MSAPLFELVTREDYRARLVKWVTHLTGCRSCSERETRTRVFKFHGKPKKFPYVVVTGAAPRRSQCPTGIALHDAFLAVDVQAGGGRD